MKIVLPKKIKIFLCVFTAIFALLFLSVFVLQFLLANKVETADFYLKEITPSDYKAQIDFKKLKLNGEEGAVSDLIFINDCSADKTINILLSAQKQKENANIRIINFTRNFGQVAINIIFRFEQYCFS